MREELTVKILAQTSESIQKLFDLTTRIDERVKSIHASQEALNAKTIELNNNYTLLMGRIIKLESRSSESLQGEIDRLMRKVDEQEKLWNILDRRIQSAEQTAKTQEGRWSSIFSFGIQMVWVVLAAWVLFKLNLNPPPVP